MRVIFLGPPGAGKGTQARRAATRWGVPQIATGDMLRGAMAGGTELGRKAKRYYDAGELVPDDVIIDLVAEVLARPEARKGFVLDGFPRTVAQAEALDRLLDERGLTLDRVVVFDIGEDALVERLGGRRVCPRCGRNYHVRFSPPARPGVCDACGTTLVQRSDDEESTVRRRLGVYARDTRPLIERYRGRGLVETIPAAGSVDEVAAAVLQATESGR
ncbi:MAG: adenylate kinase [Candidatus Rokuibacteriota bacterium]